MLLLTSTWSLFAQKDSVVWDMEIGTLASKRDVLPHYLHSNVGGLFDYDFDGPYLKTSFKGVVSGIRNQNLSFGAELLVLNQTPLINFQQLFVDYKWGPLRLSAGRQAISQSEIQSLEIGDYGISNNARPIPRVGFFIDDYWKLPFLPDLLAIKASMFHGWMEKGRAINNPWLHGKTFYLKLGNEKISIAGGLSHYVIFGGTSSTDGNDLPKGIGDYWRAFWGKGLPEVVLGEGNGLGSHLGYWDFEVSFKVNEAKIRVYNKSPYEDRRSAQFWNLKRNKDRVVGIAILKPKRGLVNGITFQYLTTFFQQGAGLPDDIPVGVNNFGHRFGGRDDNYNNFLYRDGWTYHDRVIGNPLFMDRSLAAFYFENLNPHGVAIVNNRIRAIHIGISGEIKGWKYRLMSTFSNNLGTYSGLYDGRLSWGGVQVDPNFDYAFKNGLNQNHFLIEVEKNPFERKKNLAVRLKLAMDQGDIVNNFGAALSLNYSGLLDLAKREERSN